tara:strand:- start:3237 stop:4130 length:894 start_codon:yes stop_codon:yes gene_type:complete
MKGQLKTIYNLMPFKRELFSLIRSIGSPPYSIYKHLHFKGKIKIRIEDNYFLMRHYGYQIENELFWGGLNDAWEKTSLSLWIKLCKISRCVFDIGANTGIYSLLAKCVNPNLSVFAFEPVPEMYKKLKLNCDLNRFEVKCIEIAVSDKDGTASIYLPETGEAYSVAVNKNLFNSGASVFEKKINTGRLFSFISKHGIPNVDLMKIDVESHEVEVLKGMGQYLQQMKPTMLIEILEDSLGEEIENLLADIDYLYFNVNENNTLRLVEHIKKSDKYNYLIIRREIANDCDWLKTGILPA